MQQPSTQQQVNPQPLQPVPVAKLLHRYINSPWLLLAVPLLIGGFWLVLPLSGCILCLCISLREPLQWFKQLCSYTSRVIAKLDEQCSAVALLFISSADYPYEYCG